MSTLTKVRTTDAAGIVTYFVEARIPYGSSEAVFSSSITGDPAVPDPDPAIPVTVVTADVEALRDDAVDIITALGAF